jgi:hypothetical protein
VDDNGVKGGRPVGGTAPVRAGRGLVRVAGVQWALWGKAATDTEYRVLSCSDGTFDVNHFTGLLTRYSPGTLDKDRLPQFTISWVRDSADTSYLAVAIHEQAPENQQRAYGRSRTDAAGRPIVYVRYFAVGYGDLAEHAVTYRELAGGLRNCELPPRSAAPVTVALPRLAPRAAGGPVLELAQRTAAALLSTRPICLVGAGDLGTEDRLWFIDTVMSLLPYGLRTAMSAATWASSTTQDHKLRLFFSAVPRPRSGDLVATWNQPGSVPVDDPDVAAYLAWLAERPWAGRRLAGRTAPSGFRKEDVQEIIRTLPFGLDDDLTVEEALEGMGEALLGGDLVAFKQYLDHLRRRLGGGNAEVDRHRCLDVIKRYGLLGSQPLIPPGLRAEFQRMLLSLGFAVPLTYAGYLELENCVGGQLGRDQELLGIVLGMELTSIPWILVNLAKGGGIDAVLAQFPSREEALRLLRMLDEDSRLRTSLIQPAHGQAVLDVSVRYLLKYDTGGYRKELRTLGYLAQALEHYFGADRGEQRSRLISIVRNVHGPRLDRRAIAQILNAPDRMPTDALLSAVVAEAGRGDRRFARELFAAARTADMDAVGGHVTIGLTGAVPVVSAVGGARRLVLAGAIVVAAVLAFLIYAVLSGSGHH